MKFNTISPLLRTLLLTHAMAEATHHGHPVGTVVSPENPATAPTATVLPEPTKLPLSFEINEFEEGDFKGFKFTVPEFGTLDKAVETYGAEKVLSLLNTQINARIRTKVKNALPKNLKPQDLAAKHAELFQKHGKDGVLFTEQEATDWRPEVRELSPNQLFKKSKEAFKKANETNDPLERTRLLTEGTNFLLEAGKAMQS